MVSFLNKASIQQTLNTIPQIQSYLMHATRMHPDVHEIIEEFQINVEAKYNVEVVGLINCIKRMEDFEKFSKNKNKTNKFLKLLDLKSVINLFWINPNR